MTSSAVSQKCVAFQADKNRSDVRRAGAGPAYTLALAALTLATMGAYAASESEELEFQTLPPEPKRPSSNADESSEPEVRIIRRKDATIEEYWVNGQVRAVKVIPAQGPEYYLIDTDGDGQLDTRSSELSDDILVPGWVIFSW